jgi:cytosine deaminase
VADVWVDGAGRIARDAVPGARVVKAAGRLLAPALAEPHAHLDRAFSLEVTGPNRSGSLGEAIQRFDAALDQMTVASLRPGAQRALHMMSSAGVAHVRTHTAVGGRLAFRAWEAVDVAARAVPEVKVQQVPMPMDPNCQLPQVAAWIREAIARGGVAVGGAPWLADDPAAATRAAAELAAELGTQLDLHVDESDDPAVSTLAVLADAVREVGLTGRAVAAHCCSLGTRPGRIARGEAEAIAASGISVVLLPVSNLALQGQSSGVRGLAPARLLREAGVTIAVGTDNIRDVVVGAGTPDPLRAAWLLAIAGHLTDEEALTWLGDVVFRQNRVVCRVASGLLPGDPADLILIDAATAGDAVALAPGRVRL